jgi:hypothetical protein
MTLSIVLENLKKIITQDSVLQIVQVMYCGGTFWLLGWILLLFAWISVERLSAF